MKYFHLILGVENLIILYSNWSEDDLKTTFINPYLENKQLLAQGHWYYPKDIKKIRIFTSNLDLAGYTNLESVLMADLTDVQKINQLQKGIKRCLKRSKNSLLHDHYAVFSHLLDL